MTFCLSDIEGSTSRWESDPAAMAEALVRHDEIIAAQVESRAGRFLKSMGEGDSTVSVFESAPEAVAAAVAANRALTEEQWPRGLRLAVRFGVRTGEAERRGADYVGPTLHMAARLRAQADGGQVFLSATTAALAGSHLPDGCELVDLGPHRLRGLSTPERIHAVRGPGLSAPLPAHECPYRGLLAFEPDDRGFFFGREQVVEEILARLSSGRLLAVIGASGSGKSSVLRAGAVAAVLAGEVEGLRGARIITPGPEPVLEASGDARELIVVDQFEELYTLCEDAARRDAFIEALLALASPVVIGMRADLYGRLSGHAELARAASTNQVLLGAMGDAEIERAITQPARLAGLRLQPGLVELILRDVASEPGALPLLSHALRVTWERRDGRTLTVDGYRESGGVASAIAQSADSVVESMPPDRHPLMRNLLLRLTVLGEGIEDTRRRVPVQELIPDDGAAGEVRSVLERLADARLVTLGDGTAEVAHEVLIREWPTLRAWLEEDRAGIRLHRQLGSAARMWETGGQEATDLYRGTRLDAALEWAQEQPHALNATERAFLEASVAHSQSERRAQLRANRRLRVLLAGAGLLLVAAVVAGVLALRENDRARDAARTADAQRLGAQALVDDRLERSLLLAQAGRALDDSVATRGYLLSALVRHPAALGVMQGDGDRLLYMALSRDGDLLAVSDNDGTVAVLDTHTRRGLGPPVQMPGPITAVDFDPAGQRLLIAGALEHAKPTNDPAGQARAGVRIIDVRTRRTLREFGVGPYPGKGRFFQLVQARFGPDGRTVVVGQVPDQAEGRAPTYARRYDSRTGKPIAGAVAITRRTASLSAPVDAQRDMIVTTGMDETYVLDARTLERRRRIPVGDFSGALSPDGRSVALGGLDGSVALLDLRTGARRTLAGRHEDPVQQLAFNADGRTLATTGDDGRVLVWDLEKGDVRETLTGHTGRITSLRVSADGRTLYTAGLDSRIIVWDVAGDRRMGRPFKAGEPVEEYPPPLALSRDGQHVATGLPEGGVGLHDAKTLRGAREVRAQKRLAAVVDFSPDGRMIAVTGEDGGAVEFRNVATGRRARPPLRGLGPPAQAMAFSPDGRRLVVADLEGYMRLLDLRSGRVRQAPRLPTFAIQLSYSPDGNTIAVSLYDKGTQLHDGRTLANLGTLASEGEPVRWSEFSPDGRLIAVGHVTGFAQLWDVAARRRVGPRLTGHEGFVINAEFSPDGKRLATSGTDGTVILWDVASRRALGTLPGRHGWVAARFHPNGRWLFVLHDTGDAERWEISPAAWSRHACRVGGRELTRTEWEQLVPDQEYRPICGA